MDNIKKVRRRYELWIFGSIGIACLGVIQFCVCIWIAIANYPEPFSLATHLFTDLGRESNDYGAVFNGSLIILGLTLIPLFVLMPFIDIRSSHSKHVVATTGVLSSLGIVAIGLTPNDNLFVEHYIALFAWVMPTTIMILAFFYLVSNNPNMSIWFIATSLITVVLMLGFLLASREVNRNLMQKFLLVYVLIWFGFIAWFAYRCGRLALANAMLDHKSTEELAEEYAQELMGSDTHRN